MAKKKKLTVAELKRRLIPGAKVILAEFSGTEINKTRCVIRVATSYVALVDDDLDSKKESLLLWPKASELKEVDGGFRIDSKYNTSIYKWID
jgi:hypothetical protein